MASIQEGFITEEVAVMVLPWIGVGVAKKESRDSGNIFTAQFSNPFEGL
jgi:hypothetical protein